MTSIEVDQSLSYYIAVPHEPTVRLGVNLAQDAAPDASTALPLFFIGRYAAQQRFKIFTPTNGCDEESVVSVQVEGKNLILVEREGGSLWLEPMDKTAIKNNACFRVYHGLDGSDSISLESVSAPRKFLYFDQGETCGALLREVFTDEEKSHASFELLDASQVAAHSVEPEVCSKVKASGREFMDSLNDAPKNIMKIGSPDWSDLSTTDQAVAGGVLAAVSLVALSVIPIIWGLISWRKRRRQRMVMIDE